MGDLIGAADAVRLLQDEELRAEVIKQIVSDPDTMSDLAEEIADTLSDILEEDPVFKKELFEAALANAEFKAKIVKELVDEIAD